MLLEYGYVPLLTEENMEEREGKKGVCAPHTALTVSFIYAQLFLFKAQGDVYN